jgi:hypothetical protein
MRVVSLLPAATEIVAALGGAIGAPVGHTRPRGRRSSASPTNATFHPMSGCCRASPGRRSTAPCRRAGSTGRSRRPGQSALPLSQSTSPPSRPCDPMSSSVRRCVTCATWPDLSALAPECVIVALCGIGLARAARGCGASRCGGGATALPGCRIPRRERLYFAARPPAGRCRRTACGVDFRLTIAPYRSRSIAPCSVGFWRRVIS